MSLLSAYPGGKWYAYDSSPPHGPLLHQLGFKRPAEQGGTTSQCGFVEVAGERLGEHEADIVISLVGPRNRGIPLFDDPLLDTTVNELAPRLALTPKRSAAAAPVEAPEVTVCALRHPGVVYA